MSTPIFLSEDITAIQADLLAAYLANGGTMPAAASTEQLMLNTCAYSIYRNNLLVNDAIRQNFVAFARGVMLDYLGELTGVVRLDGENDDAYRARIPLRLEAHAAGGTAGYYRYQAMSVSSDISDVAVLNEGAGNVHIYLLSQTDATQDDDLALVRAFLTSDDVRSLCDHLTISIANPVHYTVAASLSLANGVTATIAESAIQSALSVLNNQWRSLGKAIVPSQIITAITATGVVSRVELTTPEFIQVGANEYPLMAEAVISWL